MSKRKKGAPQDMSSHSKGKRMREHGRLKIQDDEDYNAEEIQILKDAGVDDETLISDHEKQAIIKAIKESNQHQKHNDDVEPSVSEDSTEISSGRPNSCDDMETQPYDASISSNSSSPIDNCIPLPLMMKCETVSLEDETFEKDPSDDNSSQCFFVTKWMDTTVLPRKDNDTTLQPEEEDVKLEPEEPPLVLAAETQFSPHRTDSSDIDLGTVPESPSPPHSDSRVTDNNVEDCVVQESHCLHRVYPTRTGLSYKNYPPRISYSGIQDPSSYTQVIKLMFDIYIRRLRSAQRWSKREPMKWGIPVRPGAHCENLLRRKVLEQAKSGKSGRTRRGRCIEKKVENEDEICEKGQICDLSEPKLVDADDINGSFSQTVLVNKTPKVCGTEVRNCTDAVTGSPDLCLIVIDDANNKQSEPKRGRSKSKLKNKLNRKVEYVSDVSHSIEQETSLRIHQSFNNVVCSTNDDGNIIQHPDCVVLDVEEDGNDKTTEVNRLWLSSEKDDGKKKTEVKAKKQITKKKDRFVPVPAHVEGSVKSIFQDWDRRKSNKYSRKTGVYVIEDNGDSSSFPDIESCHDEKKAGRGVKGTDNDHGETGENELPCMKNEFTDDIPSSLESGIMLNSHGDMYCTQIAHKSRRNKKRETEKSAGMMHQYESRSMPATSTGSQKVDEVKEIAVESVCDVEFISEVVKSQNNRSDDNVKKRKRVEKQLPNSKKNLGVLESPPWNFECDVGREDKKTSYKSTERERVIATVSAVEGIGKSKAVNKKKRKLFDDVSYLFEESGQKQILAKSSDRKKDRFKCDKIEEDGRTTDEREDFPQGMGSNPTEEITDKGQCPICEKSFILNQLEAHAATCGDGNQDCIKEEIVSCMICSMEIENKMLKEHQNHCINERTKEQQPTKRITRARNTSPKRKRKVPREKSPSSSEEDYGNLIIEGAKEKM